MYNNRITNLFNINYPVIQAGMVWTSGWKLASAVSNAGGLGLIGSGSMYPDVLKLHIQKCKAATSKPFGVNIPLLYPDIEKHIQTVIDEEIKIVFTSAGNPKIYTSILKQHGITVVHVVSSSMFAKKAEDAGCDAVVAEGFEAGGHNGREETTTMVLIPAVCNAVKIPVIAAGGIATGKQMLAAMVLGADGVQIGSRFVCSNEASNHIKFKEAIINSKEGDTMLSLKKVTPVRLFKNNFFKQVDEAEARGATKGELAAMLGHGRAKKGMLEGELDEGELEIGEVSALIKDIKPAAEIVQEIWKDFNDAVENISLTKKIMDARNITNHAIANHDVKTLSNYWLDDIVIIRGNGNIIHNKTEAKKVWQAIFETQPEISFVREPQEIVINANDSLAWEKGIWKGINTYSGGGNYSAMWKKQDNEWKLQAELYVSLE